MAGEVGYIYKFTNPKNNKSYIGKTNNIHRRFISHKCATTKQDSKFGKALRKYGIHYFIYSTLYTVICSDIDILDKALEILEIEAIEQYNSFNKGYNSTSGGDSPYTKGKKRFEYSRIRCSETRLKQSIAKKIPIIQYDKLGNFIKFWDSAADAELHTGIHNAHISKCCKGIRKTAGKYMWKYEKNINYGK